MLWKDEIRQIHEACNGHILKVIIETALLAEEEISQIIMSREQELSSLNINRFALALVQHCEHIHH